MKSWNIPKPGARFVAKMEDVLDVYQRSYDPEYPQVCVDEISKTLRSTPRGSLLLEPGKPRREDYEYSMGNVRFSWPLNRYKDSGEFG